MSEEYQEAAISSSLQGKTIAGGALRGILGRGAGYLAQYVFVAACTRGLGSQTAGDILAILALVNVAGVIGRFGLDSCALREISISYGSGQLWLARRQAAVIFCVAGGVSLLLTLAVWISRRPILDFFGITGLLGADGLLLLIPLVTLTGVMGEILRATRCMIASAVTQLIFVYLVPVVLLLPGIVDVSVSSALVIYGLAAGAFSGLVYGAAVFWFVTRSAMLPPTKSDYSMLFSGAAHFMLMSAITMYLASIDVLIVSRYLGSAEVAVYVACARTAMIISLGLIGLGGILAPNLASSFASNDSRRMSDLMESGARWAMFQGVLAASILLLISRHLLLIFGEGFDQFTSILSLLIVGQTINAAFGPVAVVLAMTRKERQGAIILVLTAIVGTSMYLVMVPIAGLLGAAVSNLIVVVIWNTGMALVAWRGLKSRATFIRIAMAPLFLLPAYITARYVTGLGPVAMASNVVVLLCVSVLCWYLVLRRSDRGMFLNLVRTRVHRNVGTGP